MIEDILKEKLDIVCKASELSNEEYAKIRKTSFGASDSSVLCGVNLYKTLPQLIQEKNTAELTEEEKEIGEKVFVRKGKDLEPLNLKKFEEATGLPVTKPEFMYRHKVYKSLTTNFDGVIEDIAVDSLIPVEAKWVSKYGERYYNKFIIDSSETRNMLNTIVKHNGSDKIKEHIERVSQACGIPPYYYTQVQQQMLFLDAPYGYLQAMFDDSWTFKYYYVPKDLHTQLYIISAAEREIENIKRQD